MKKSKIASEVLHITRKKDDQVVYIGTNQIPEHLATKLRQYPKKYRVVKIKTSTIDEANNLIKAALQEYYAMYKKQPLENAFDINKVKEEKLNEIN